MFRSSYENYYFWYKFVPHWGRRVKKVKEAGPVHVDLEDSEVKVSDDKLDIGFSTKALLKKLVDGGCDMDKVSKFYLAVRAFYGQGLLYARSRLPLDDPVLKNARFLDFAQRDSCELSHVEYFATRFAAAINFDSSPQSMEWLKDEFISYQLLENSDVPAHVWSKAAIYIEDKTTASQKPGFYSMDILWAYLSTMTHVDGSPKFSILAEVAQLVLTIPHSNAAEERVFSLVRKNKTPFRPNLDPDETLGSIVTTKMALPKDIPAFKFEPAKELLVASKKATKLYNNAHRST